MRGAPSLRARAGLAGRRLRHLVPPRRRTYDVLGGAGGVDLDEGPGLVATQALMSFFADTEDAAEISLTWVGLGAHGG
jgi:hypothetical protein